MHWTFPGNVFGPGNGSPMARNFVFVVVLLLLVVGDVVIQ